jgi:hypothetical protein
MKDLEAKFGRLEKEVKALRLGLVTVLAMGVGLSLLAFRQAPRELKATVLDIVNEEGKTVMLLTGEEEGGYLGIYRPGFERGVEMTADKHGGAVMVFDYEGREVARMLPGMDGGVFEAVNHEGFPIASLVAGEEGGYAAMAKPNGEPVANLSAAYFGGNLSLRGPEGRHGLSAYMLTDGAHLAIFDEKGEGVGSLREEEES